MPNFYIEFTRFLANGGDDYFYRAEILAVHYQSQFVDVRYIDYGNTAHISTDNLIDLPKSLTTLAPQAIHCRLPLTKEVFIRNRMYTALTQYQDRCNSGDTLGMEIYEIPTHAKQPAKVNLLINNVPLLTRKDSKPKTGPVQLYQKKLSVKSTYKFTIIEGTDFQHSIQLTTTVRGSLISLVSQKTMLKS